MLRRPRTLAEVNAAVEAGSVPRSEFLAKFGVAEPSGPPVTYHAQINATLATLSELPAPVRFSVAAIEMKAILERGEIDLEWCVDVIQDIGIAHLFGQHQRRLRECSL